MNRGGTLKFKGNKGVSDIIKASSSGKAAVSLLEKRSNSDVQKKDIWQRKTEELKDKQKQQEKQKFEEQKCLEEARDVIIKTVYEQGYEVIQKKRLMDKIKTNTEKTHREKMVDFNQNLSKLPDHYDIPKVGPG